MRRKKRVQLSKDEIYLFDYLFRHRVASGKTIYRDIFSKYKTSESARIRLSRLRKSGFIRGKYFNNENRDMCYGLTSSTVKEFIDFSRSAYIWKGTNSPNHDIGLIDIWKAIKNRDIINFMLTEHEYNVRDSSKCSEARLLLGELKPDGYLEISMGSKKFVATLEYERSAKTKARYLDMIDRYYRNKEVKAVFYISEKEHIENQVKGAELEYRTRHQEPKFFYALKEDINCNDNLVFNTVGDKEYRIEMKLNDTHTDTNVTDIVHLNSMQSIENIRKTIVTKFFAENPSSPLYREYNNKPQTIINETGGLNEN